MQVHAAKTKVYSRHTVRYSSYAGAIGMIKKNVLKQQFNETISYYVLHTGITKYKKFYISLVIDNASLKILFCQAQYFA